MKHSVNQYASGLRDLPCEYLDEQRIDSGGLPVYLEACSQVLLKPPARSFRWSHAAKARG
jgi:hypothetical protein